MNVNNMCEIDGIRVYHFPMVAIESNMYMIIEDGEALVVDPNTNEKAIRLLRDYHVNKVLILLTHEHHDHISGVNLYRELFDVNVICSSACANNLGDPRKNLAAFWEILVMDKNEDLRKQAESVKDDDYICEADITFDSETLIHWKLHELILKEMPGHSKGSILIEMNGNILFTGDSLVNGHGIIYKFPGGSWKQIEKSVIPTISMYSDNIYILPGHGSVSRLKDVRKYLCKFGFVE